VATIGSTRRIDQLGRVVVPAELRRTLGMQEGDIISFTARGDELVLSRVAPTCAICANSADDLFDVHDKHLCRSCVDQIRFELSAV
jgi:AbrB family transcriptional regulator, transcriptional pleiotropic regulator of transition state genes